MTDIIKLRDLPGVAEMEAALHIPGKQLIKEFDDLDERIAAAGQRLFGISEPDTHFPATEADYERRRHSDELLTLTPEAQKRWEAWEAHFEFLEYEYEEEGDFWSAFGWDVFHDNGDELLILGYWGRQHVCLLKRLHPDARFSPAGDGKSISAEAWGRSLEAQAAQFQAGKRK